jgi:surfactin synthase thioesterase subunit
MQEECRGWDINEVVFGAGLWGMYQPLLRADFRLFDEYQMGPPQGGAEGAGGAPLLDCPLTTFYGSRDRRVEQHMVQVGNGCGRMASGDGLPEAAHAWGWGGGGGVARA